VFAYDNKPWRDGEYLAKTTRPGRAVASVVRDHLRDAVPEIPLYGIATLEETMATRRSEMRNLATGASIAGALVLLLASIGLYGVIGLAVAQRRREIGIRIALGASPLAVVGLLFRQGLRLGGLGLLLGLPFSIGALMVIGKLMEGAGDNGSMSVNPVILGVVIASSVLVVASLATWVPARRAASIAPTLALRAE
jgi:ABC-type antimicrobial peptide transport system permease subunit